MAGLWVGLTVVVDGVDEVLHLGLGRVLSQGAHDPEQLAGGDGALPLRVKHVKRLLKV